MIPPYPHGHHLARAALGVLATVLLCAPVARAGQVRIDATSNLVFADSSAAINPGDQIVWVSTGGIHTVTSGTVDGSGTAHPDGRFGSPNISSGTNGCFAWKSSGTGSVPYYCTPHASFGMIARLRIITGGTPVSDFRITEVRWTAAHDHDFVEIANLGDASGNLGRYRLSLAGETPLVLPLRDIVVPSQGRVVVNLNQSGTNTATQLYFPAGPGVTIGPVGSAALYCATTAPADTAMTNAMLMVDYVQWAVPGWRNETTAGTAGLWTIGDVVPAVAEGHSIEFCGTRADRGLLFWQGSPTPTPGGINCLTPVISATWGRLKTLYR
jgi:plastocyanin